MTNRHLTVAALLLPLTATALPHSALADQNRAAAFASNIWPNVNFLDRSSRLAITKSRSTAVREFASKEAADQTVAANAVVAWMASMAPKPVGEAASASGNMMSMPFRAAAKMSSDMADNIDGLQTGRSVAINDEVSGPPVALKEIRLDSANANIDRLASLSGRAFDKLYRQTQQDALTQLSTIYATYVQAGQDPGLRNLAIRELPKVNGALSRLRALQ